MKETLAVSIANRNRLRSYSKQKLALMKVKETTQSNKPTAALLRKRDIVKAGQEKEKAEHNLRLLRNFNAKKDKESRSDKRWEKNGKDKLRRSAKSKTTKYDSDEDDTDEEDDEDDEEDEEDEEDEDDKVKDVHNYNQGEEKNDSSEGNKDKEDGDMVTEHADDMEFIEKIVGHRTDPKMGKQLKVQWDNGSIEWHRYGNVVKDEFFMVKEYVQKHGLEKKGWKLPVKGKKSTLSEILDDRLDKDGTCELECVYDNGFREWNSRNMVEKVNKSLVEEYFKNISED